MMLFKPEHVPLILSGRKTQTRRLGKKRWNVGAIHQCQTKMLRNDSVFAHVRILDVSRSDPIASLSDEAVYAEGYDEWRDFWSVWCAINGGGSSPSATPWVVEFELVTAPVRSGG